MKATCRCRTLNTREVFGGQFVILGMRFSDGAKDWSWKFARPLTRKIISQHHVLLFEMLSIAKVLRIRIPIAETSRATSSRSTVVAYALRVSK